MITRPARHALTALHNGTMQAPAERTPEVLELVLAHFVIYCGRIGGRRSIVITNEGRAALGVSA